MSDLLSVVPGMFGFSFSHLWDCGFGQVDVVRVIVQLLARVREFPKTRKFLLYTYKAAVGRYMYRSRRESPE